MLKDVTSSPLQMLKKPEMDSVRMGQFPNLDYKGLYNSLVPFVEVTPLLQTGVHGNYTTFGTLMKVHFLLHSLFLGFINMNVIFRVWTGNFTMFGLSFTIFGL